MQLKNLLKVVVFALLCFCIEPAFAQNKVITGKVTDKKDGSPIVGATVVTVVGGQNGTVTDVNGNFKINVPTGTNTLTISFVGYNRQVVTIGDKSLINVSLESNSSNLNE